jgi:hypothetical protein
MKPKSIKDERPVYFPYLFLVASEHKQGPLTLFNGYIN